MPGSKNIRIFEDWFGMDSKSRLKEATICENLSSEIYPESEWKWSSDKSSFWLNEKNSYFIHRCDVCKKNFNYPSPVWGCPVCETKIEKCVRTWIGRVEPPSEKEWNNSSSGVNPETLKMAKADLAANPVKEEKFDWEHLKNTL